MSMELPMESGLGNFHTSFFEDPLAVVDPSLFDMIEKEKSRQRNEIELIASENIVSRAVLEAQGSVLSNKTVEGYPGDRYHGGAHIVDEVENLVVQRACMLFEAGYANAQPHSGSQANQAVFKSLLKPGDTVLSMDLRAGGHLSHGSKANLSGQVYDIKSYTVRPDSGRIDYDQVRALAQKEKPHLIVAGGSSYPRELDLQAFRDIADECGAFLLVDMAHFAGLVAGGVLANPVAFADVVTTTTYKSLRGARGGLILARDAEFGQRFQSAVFPGVQGSPMLNMLAAKAVGLSEASQPEFKNYAAAVLANARTLAENLNGAGIPVVSDGTDTPIVLVDVTTFNLTGREACELLGRANITCNKNMIPMDPRKPQEASGLRFGTSAVTTRGMTAIDLANVGEWIGAILNTAKAGGNNVDALISTIKHDAMALAQSKSFYPF